ncbi:DUF3606 domain-containing protein [Rhizobium sp. Leaf386]|uniref:DUF3606 domain-containing protein n=1 Tax=Rhizobium sp. Leaf386 TaxID=1736359 RepID=UPI0007141608|nr:DUF3606 domain-containing protein [Rhizobium sp. Leaf386]KQS95381.1 hypothetical protein ASG50_25490 [Rhizobium sp. Leaf386]
MADDKKAVKQDRKRVAAKQPYELSYFKRKHNLSTEAAEKIIKQAGNNREKANELAEKLAK